MKFSFNFLQSFFEKKLPKPFKIAEILTLRAFEVKEIEKIENDFVLDIDILPNRGDCLSHLGIAREVAAILNLKIKLPETKIKEETEKDVCAHNILVLKIQDSELCRRYTARLLENIKIGPSPSWLVKRLKSCGLKSINNVVDVANYVMLETGQPLHVFDFDKIEGEKKDKKEIRVRLAKKGENFLSLDNEKIELDKEILVIADKKEPLAIAGIKGGKKAEVDNNTQRILIESANFAPFCIRSGSKKIDLKTDASLRFEYGVDPNLTEFAVNRASFLIQKLARGKIISGLIDFYPKKVFPKKNKLYFENVNKILGILIPEQKVISILKKLDFKILNYNKNFLTLEIPTFRQDIVLPEDLIEEIVRILGYEKILPVLPVTVLVPAQKNLNLFWETRAKETLKEVGLSEVYNYSFIGEKEKEIFKFKTLLEIENPVSSEYRYLRPSLIPNLLKNIEKNQNFFKEIKIFEVGKIFPFFPKKEKKMLTAALTGERFFELKGIVDLLLERMGITGAWYDEFKPTPEESEMLIWHPKKCAEIKVGQEEIGFLGEISTKIALFLKLKEKICVFDINFEKMAKLASEEIFYEPPSPFPPVIRDLAVLVPRETKIDDVLNIIEIAGEDLLIDVELFDIYEKEDLIEGQKSLAFHLIFQAKDRVLTSSEIQQLQDKIIKAIEDQGWNLRK